MIKDISEEQRQNIAELAMFLEREDYKFDANHAWAEPEKGIGGCIGAHAAILWPEVRQEVEGHNMEDLYTYAMGPLAKRMGITLRSDFTRLTVSFPDQDGADQDAKSITRQQAIGCLWRLWEGRGGEVYFHTAA